MNPSFQSQDIQFQYILFGLSYYPTQSIVYSLRPESPDNVKIVEGLDESGLPVGKLYATGKFDFETEPSLSFMVCS